MENAQEFLIPCFLKQAEDTTELTGVPLLCVTTQNRVGKQAVNRSPSGISRCLTSAQVSALLGIDAAHIHPHPLLLWVVLPNDSTAAPLRMLSVLQTCLMCSLEAELFVFHRKTHCQKDGQVTQFHTEDLKSNVTVQLGGILEHQVWLEVVHYHRNWKLLSHRK